MNSITQENLITNGSFEDIDSCYGAPAAIGFDVFEWSGCKGWSNPIASSSDLWCQNPVFGNQSPPFIPGLGYQMPYDGKNMASILINDGVMFNYREYIQNELKSSLEANTYYKIEFYVSGNLSMCSCSGFGVKFFTSKFSDQSTLWLTDIIPDAVNDNSQYFLDTAIWQKIEMNYIANGTEKFAVIGNFQDSLSMTYVHPCDTSFWGNLTLAGDYFFVDDVSITKMPGFANIPNVFTPNGDGVNDVWRLPFNQGEGYHTVSIIDRWGNLVYLADLHDFQWNGHTSTGDACNDGVYFYRISKTNIAGFIQLMR